MLRDKQAASGQLSKWPASFLWGPPGTGKTTTLGAMVASLLLDNPSYKILLLSTTNSAIDQALIAVDKALEDALDPHAETVRHNCKRIGIQFIAHHYQDRNHLLPQRNKALITRLIDHNRNRPKHDNLVAMARWKEIDSELRQRMREENRKILESSRLAVMTTTRGAFDLEMLRELPTYDLLVIDEASQVSLAHGLAMMPLARSVLFAGDPMQLSPICQSDTAMARKWIGRSPFAIYEKVNSRDSKCFLTEQSRMAPAICAIVSDLFYGGDLVVCNKAIGDPIWHAERTVTYADAEGGVVPVPVIEEGRFVPQLDGYARDESARRITEIVRGLLRTGILESDLQILTPFRAQRRLIRRHLREQDLQIIVTTVHRAQGGERKVIIFDPVQGGGTFLNCERDSDSSMLHSAGQKGSSSSCFPKVTHETRNWDRCIMGQ